MYIKPSFCLHCFYLLVSENKAQQKIEYDTVANMYTCYHLMYAGDTVIQREYEEPPVKMQRVTKKDNQVIDWKFYRNKQLCTFFKQTHPDYATIQKEMKRYYLKEFHFNKVTSIVQTFESEIDTKLGLLFQERVQLAARKRRNRQKLITNYNKIMSECSKLADCVTIQEFDIYWNYLEKKLLR